MLCLGGVLGGHHGGRSRISGHRKSNLFCVLKQYSGSCASLGKTFKAAQTIITRRYYYYEYLVLESIVVVQEYSTRTTRSTVLVTGVLQCYVIRYLVTYLDSEYSLFLTEQQVPTVVQHPKTFD